MGQSSSSYYLHNTNNRDATAQLYFLAISAQNDRHIDVDVIMRPLRSCAKDRARGRASSSLQLEMIPHSSTVPVRIL